MLLLRMATCGPDGTEDSSTTTGPHSKKWARSSNWRMSSPEYRCFASNRLFRSGVFLCLWVLGIVGFVSKTTAQTTRRITWTSHGTNEVLDWEQAYPLAATASNGLPVEFPLPSGPAYVTKEMVTATGAGFITLVAQQKVNGHLAESTVTQPLNRDPLDIVARAAKPTQPQSLTIDVPLTAELGASPLKIIATASSGLPVAVKVKSGPAEMDGDRLNLRDLGTVVLQFVQTGDLNYTEIIEERTIVILPVKPRIELPDPFYDTTVYLSTNIVRFNQFGSNRVDGAASSCALTWTKEENSPFGMSTAFSVSTENIDAESPVVYISCGRYFYIESQSQKPVAVRMTVKGTLNIDYRADYKPDRSLDHGYFCGLMMGRIAGESVLGGEVLSGFKMDKVGVGLPKLETYMGTSNPGEPFEYKITNSIDFSTNILVTPNMRCFALIDVKLWHYRNSRYPEIFEYQNFNNNGDLKLELAIDPSEIDKSRIISGKDHPVLSFEYKADQMIMKYSGILQAADALDGPFVDLPNVQSPYTETIGNGRFFRTRLP